MCWSRLVSDFGGWKLHVKGKNWLVERVWMEETEAIIDKIQNYSGLAIRQNIHSVKAMKTAVWYILFHMCSSDESPNHELCPKRGDSWCKYHKAKECGQSFSHKNSLPYAIVEEIKSIFKDLTNIELLKKCLYGQIQNPNQCVSSIIWARLPKTVFVSMSRLILHFGVYDTVISFNDGNMCICKVLQSLLKTVELHTVKAMYKMDKVRFRAADKYARDIEMKARQHSRSA